MKILRDKFASVETTKKPSTFKIFYHSYFLLKNHPPLNMINNTKNNAKIDISGFWIALINISLV